jgi:hypothetical protein
VKAYKAILLHRSCQCARIVLTLSSKF